jgi:hypothetical protein
MRDNQNGFYYEDGIPFELSSAGELTYAINNILALKNLKLRASQRQCTSL